MRFRFRTDLQLTQCVGCSRTAGTASARSSWIVLTDGRGVSRSNYLPCSFFWGRELEVGDAGGDVGQRQGWIWGKKLGDMRYLDTYLLLLLLPLSTCLAPTPAARDARPDARNATNSDRNAPDVKLPALGVSM